MRYLYFTPQEEATYPVCLLVPSTALQPDSIKETYFTNSAIQPEDVIVLTLHQSETKKKTPVAEIKKYLVEELMPAINNIGSQYIICTDAEYFKTLTKSAKVDANLGYVLPCAFGSQMVVYAPSHRAVFYDPVKIKTKIATAIQSIADHVSGNYEHPGTDILKFEAYPKTLNDISAWLDKLLEMNVPLTIDIEAFDLKHTKSGIGTISFAWSKHEGIAFPVDYVPIPNATSAPYGRQERNEVIRLLLREFFIKLTKTATYHNISFDVYVLIYQLFMKDILDTDGLLYGIDVLLRDWDDTKLITYLATNSCAGNKLGLKDQAQEFAGNYAMDDIVDITKIPLPTLLKYNLVDACSTWYTKEKHYNTMVADDQLEIYEEIFKPAIVDIIQMQLTGMPINMKRTIEVKHLLQIDCDAALKDIANSATVQRYTYRLNEKWVEKRNSELKVKRVTMADAKEEFNPNSGPQLQDLLFSFLGLPVISLTDSKQPSTDADTIKALLNHTNDPDILTFLKGLRNYKAVDKILNSFIPAMEKASLGSDGWHYLFGNFNLGGTLSGRLSSSNPNLQNLPASSKYAKLIKSCFQAPPGWIFGGLDFASLEDRISALTTKDPNKLKVYTDGYDGHSLRAYAYFGDLMPDIIDTVESINSIQDKYKPLRQESKAPTFALTYQGTYITLMKNCGFSLEKAKKVEARYHELYVVSDAWVEQKLDEAAKNGYITGAFGLRLRTPLLKQVIRGTSKTPYEAEAEGRTAGNALGQSWCLLNSRAGSDFMKKVRASKYHTSIRPCAQIHDAQYYLVRDGIDEIMFTNKHLVEAVKWQEHPDIAHDEVKLGGEFSIFFPDWSHEIEIPNGATEDEIFHIIDDAMTA